MSVARIRVLVVDDHAVLRSGLRALIDAQPDMKVVGEAADGEAAAQEASRTSPHVVLLDLTMPTGGPQAVSRMMRACRATRVLVLTMHDDAAYASAALAAGAAGYLAKAAAGTELLAAIRTVHQGRAYVNVSRPSASDAARQGAGAPAQLVAGAAAPPLSQRERQVLDLVARGHTNRVIAARIGVGVKTVETYRLRIGQKLGLLTRADMVAYALETGLLSSGSKRSGGPGA